MLRRDEEKKTPQGLTENTINSNIKVQSHETAITIELSTGEHKYQEISLNTQTNYKQKELIEIQDRTQQHTFSVHDCQYHSCHHHHH